MKPVLASGWGEEDLSPGLLEGADFLLALNQMDLGWFGAEDEGRTEDPTEHKIRKAREEGKVAKSQDLTAAIVLLATTGALAGLGSWMLEEMAAMVRYFLSTSASTDILTDGSVVFANFVTWFFRLTLPISLVAMVAGVAGNIFQVGFLFTTKPLKFDPKKIMPRMGAYFKRSFASLEALFNLLKALVKVAIILVVAWLTIQGNLQKLMNLPRQNVMAGFFFLASLAFQILAEAAVILLVISLGDFWFQRRQFRDSQKMTKQEIKEERKSYDGDPLVRSRLRQRMKEILSRNIMEAVPKADVVVTNPTHFAVALQYEKDSMEAPTVLAKGQDEIAFKIREIARQHNIPIIENKPLARALYAEVETGDVIPEKFYEAVVVVLRQVYRMRRLKQEAG